jgi:hypothetical protein
MLLITKQGLASFQEREKMDSFAIDIVTYRNENSARRR